MRNRVDPTIPYCTLPKSAQKCKREYPSATEDSKPGEGDGSPHWMVNNVLGIKQSGELFQREIDPVCPDDRAVLLRALAI